MSHYNSLRRRIITFTLLPGIVAALLIGAYLSYALVRDINGYEKLMLRNPRLISLPNEKSRP